MLDNVGMFIPAYMHVRFFLQCTVYAVIDIEPSCWSTKHFVDVPLFTYSVIQSSW